MALTKLGVKSGDTVVVISGKDKGKQGKVLRAMPAEGKVIVEGVNVVSKHTKARKQGDVSGIIKTEGAIYASKVQLYCPNCGCGVRVKAGYEEANGKKVKVRLCVKCGKKI